MAGMAGAGLLLNLAQRVVLGLKGGRDGQE